MDVAPRVVDLHRISYVSPRYTLSHPIVIDLSVEKKRSEKFLLSDPLLQATQEALQSGKNVLLSYNRKGDTMQEVARSIKEIIPGVPINRIEKGGQTRSKVTQPHIILATQFYFESVLDPFDPPNIGLVADLQADLGLSDPHYSAAEQTMIRLLELQGLAQRAGARALVQTWEKGTITRMLENPKQFLDGELALRKRFSYPPFGILYRCNVRGRSDQEMVLNQLKLEVQSRFPAARVHGPLMRRRPILEIRLDDENLKTFLAQQPDQIVIEVNPEK